MKNKKGSQYDIGAGIIAIFVILLIFGVTGIRIVSYNEYAVKKTFTGHLKEGIVDSGMKWIGWSTYKRVNNQVRNYEIVVDSASSDLQDVQVVLNMNIQIEKAQVYNFVKNYRNEEHYNEYLNNKIQEEVKTILLQYDAEEILKNRLKIRDEMKTRVMSITELKYFTINDLTIKDVEYTAKFNEVLEAKARVIQEREIITRQKENLMLIKENMQIIDIDTYFKYQLIEKWDGQSSLIISDAILTSASS